MKASEVMNTDVVSVAVLTPVPEIAAILLKRGVGAVPVVDDQGVGCGMVSDGDLIARSDAHRDARRDWWLDCLATGGMAKLETLSIRSLLARTAGDVMSTPLLTIGEDTDIGDIARLLDCERIKRLPVVRDGHIVGIVSRTDLLRGVFADQTEPASRRHRGWLSRAFPPHQKPHPVAAPAASLTSAADTTTFSAGEFQDLIKTYHEQDDRQRQTQRHATVVQHEHLLVELIDRHISDQSWRALLHAAREAAAQGLKEQLLLRFPSALCSDGGRAINVSEPDWPTTLRGEAAETYDRWDRDLKPKGFHLAARILDFPGGMPGDVGVFLTWT